MLTYLQGEHTGLWYEWNGAHTVNVQAEAGGQDLDCYSIGSFAEDRASYQEFMESVAEREQEYLSEQAELDSRPPKEC